MNVAAHHVSLLLAAHTTTATAPPPPHDGLYATCATLIIAVLVVLYFDERVRRGLTARIRGYAIGSLGGIIAVGILPPLLALAGMIADTAAVRQFTVLYTLAFLVFAFGIAIQNWGHEDAARIRAAQTPPPVIVPAVAVPPPREEQTEREHAAEVLAAALTILSKAHPDIVAANLSKTGPAAEATRMRQVSASWMTILPMLIAISAGYPAAEVRKQAEAFYQAGIKAMAQPASLFDGAQALTDFGQPTAEWREQATAVYGAVDEAWKALTNALHAGEQPGPAPATNGKRPRRARTTIPSGKTGTGAGN